MKSLDLSKEDASLILAGFDWMCSEGVSSHKEVGGLVRRILTLHPDLSGDYDFMLARHPANQHGDE